MKPRLTIRVPHSRRQTAPMICKNISEAKVVSSAEECLGSYDALKLCNGQGLQRIRLT